MKLFDRTGGHWLFWCGVFYVMVILGVAFSPYRDYTVVLQGLWLISISIPLWCNPLARWLNMRENHMFDKLFFKKPNNVVPFPEPKAVPDVPCVKPPEPKKEPKTYYTFGVTDDNRVSFQMGYTTLAMTKLGVDQLIEQLEFYRDRLEEEHDE